MNRKVQVQESDGGWGLVVLLYLLVPALLGAMVGGALLGTLVGMNPLSAASVGLLAWSLGLVALVGHRNRQEAENAA